MRAQTPCRTVSRGDRARRAAALAVALAALPLGLAACGSSEQRTSNLRPPTPINVSTVIGERAVTASPSKFGAGQIVIVASNQSSSSQTLTIDGPRVRRSVGPINPDDTATLKVTVAPGEYMLSGGSADLEPAKLKVGPKRPSAQNKLLQP